MIKIGEEMALTEQDRDSIRFLATEIGEKFHEAQALAMEKMAVQQRQAVEALIEHHQAVCPHGRRVMESKWFIAGALGVLTLLTTVGSLLGGILSTAFKHAFMPK